MKQSFLPFALRYVLSVLLGLGLAVLHNTVCGGWFALFIPQSTSAWELGKLAFWPLLLLCAITPTIASAARCVVATVGLVSACWLCQLAGAPGGAYVVAWMAVLAVVLLTVAPQNGGHWWFVAVLVLGVSFGALTYYPALWGPFLDPTDVAAMAVIPY